MERGHYQRQIRKMRAVYRTRRGLLIAALDEHLPQLPVSGVAFGLSVTLNLPPEVDDRDLERTARDAGIALEALTRYTIHDRGARGLVIGYGRLHETAITPAMATLRRALAGLR
jgi:GntR family transcriptional regulator / MocR family aminotransferase